MGKNSISKLPFTIFKLLVGVWEGGTNKSFLLQHAKDEVDNHVILISKDLDDSLRDPSNVFSSVDIHYYGAWDELFHNLKVDLLPVDFFRVLKGKFGALEELCVNTAGHDYQFRGR